MSLKRVRNVGTWLHDLPGRTMLKLLNHQPISRHLGKRYGAAREKHQPKLPTLSRREREIVQALETDGVFVTSLASLGLDHSDAVLEAASAMAANFAAEARRQRIEGKLFLIVPSDQIAAEPKIYRWGLNEVILNIAEAYLGLPPAYDGVIINYTVADGQQVSTRRWHRDWEDRRMLKVAVYLNDVDESGGPFEIIRTSDGKQNDMDGYRYELADDDGLARILGPASTDAKLSCVGPRGTVIFNDTARFYHRGKPATGQDRAALFFSYFARPPRHPFLCERTGMKRKHIARMAEGLPKRQREAALWRQGISPLFKLIPSATL